MGIVNHFIGPVAINHLNMYEKRADGKSFHGTCCLTAVFYRTMLRLNEMKTFLAII